MKKTIVIATVLALTCGLSLVACDAPATTEAPAAAAADARGARAEPAPAPIPPRERPSLATTAPMQAPVQAPVPVPSPAPAPAADERPAPAAPSDMRVRRLVVTRGIEAREPIDDVDLLDRDEELERIYAFVDVANAGEGAGELTVTFERDDGFVTGLVTLEVPARVGRYRTWAFSRGVRTEGAWRALVRDEDGRLLAEQAFDVR